MTALGKSVRLFLADGTPGGLITAEIMNWTGHVIAAPRSDLATLLKRAEVTRTGIYLLLGDDPDSPGRSRVYVGEGDDVSKRLRKHSGEKDFWDRAVVLTSKDMNLTKAHARYLESRFITLATQANRATLDNSTAPEPILLPEADRSDMEFFIEQAKIVLPVLGINLLRSTKPAATAAPTSPTESTLSPVFTLTVKGADATAQEVDGEFVVREGSMARPEWTGEGRSYEKLRQQLEADGTLSLLPDGSARTFTRDAVFASPSAASAVVLGRNSNGRLEWRVRGTKTTYGQWQESLLDAVDPPGRSEAVS
ncbi:GIY-YIG nuclease family protein [Nocardioides sp. GXQ0305]|uniref:GIY-YIG nuclease family protein n=1 Tax=Nocardioides sp. GXQ0305 TaxID=3423912 RepID=UPI003D7CB44B